MWSVREERTRRYALFRGYPLAGLSEKAAAIRARRLNDTVPFTAEIDYSAEEEALRPLLRARRQ